MARHFEKAELMLWPLQLRDLAASSANWSAISLPTTVCVLAPSGHLMPVLRSGARLTDVREKDIIRKEPRVLEMWGSPVASSQQRKAHFWGCPFQLVI